MFVVDVIPMRRGIAVESLSYYSRTDYSPGTILTVPIRGSDTQAIVLSSTPVSTTKTRLKSATFTLRKLPAQQPVRTIPDAFVTVAERLHTRYPATLGAILYSLLPKEVREGTCQFQTEARTIHDEDTTPQTIQAPAEERYMLYQSHTRSVLGRGGSVLCIVPSATEVATLAKTLGTGISDRVVCFSPRLTAKTRRQNWEKLQTSTQPLLIIATPGYAFVDRDDIMSILLEQAGSDQYRQRTRPYLDYCTVFTQAAHVSGCSIIFGDAVLRTEHEHRRRQDQFQSYDETPKRLILPGKLRVMRHAERIETKAPFPLFTDETINRLQTAVNQRQNVFLYAARRGLAPLIACYDCGEIVRCPDSGNPYSLLRTERDGEEVRWFVDSSSGRRVRAADTCAHCGSWRLRERGIGIQHIEAALPEHFPGIPVICFDSTTVTTPKIAKDRQREMSEAKGSIILGTTLALPYLPSSVTVSCVTSLEAAQSIPSWRADEMLFRLLMELREKSSKEVLVQTRSEVSDVVTHAERGAIERFYDEEIELREMLSYPPFATIVLLTWTGTKATVADTEHTVKEALAAYEPHCYSHPFSEANTIKRYALLRIPADTWPPVDLLAVLRTLPPHITVTIDPDRIV